MLDRSYFYTAEVKRTKVSKEEFIEFLRKYPRPLERDVCGVFDPPAVSYNDFELANRCPYSVVAYTFAYDDNPGDYYYEPEEKRSYYIVKNYEELFASKTGNVAGEEE